ncbi:hypothetical protein [Burkholderia pseudomallei]|uniref:hypothetical protein n=1 Tax=Burkholderia pseudomallei TaxID=28450 RepID=UPI001CC2707D|nr:hypothetical protein [Burkholderia pseudomallei]
MPFALRSSLFALRSSFFVLRSPLAACRSPLAARRSPLSTIRFLLSAFCAAPFDFDRARSRSVCAAFVATRAMRARRIRPVSSLFRPDIARRAQHARGAYTHRLSRSRPDRRADTVATLDRTWPAMLDLNTRASRLQRQAAPPHAQPRGTQPAPCTPRGLRDFFVERGTLYTESSRRFLECPSCSRRNRRGPGRIAARKIRI